MPVRLLWSLVIALFIAGCATAPSQTPSSAAGDRTRSDTLTGADPSAVEQKTAPSKAQAESTAPITNLWERIRLGYAIPGHDNERVSRQLQAYAEMGEYWERVSERAEPYLFHIVEELHARDMPMELALLPIVESAYRPFAYSHGRAAGIWQFIPATGRHYGLDQNWWYDGRRDVIAATDAALTYLAHLNELFDGDWLLALAAYNGGQGTVMRAQKRNARAGLPTDYWSLDLPRETMGYVPRLLAISEIIMQAEDYGIDLYPIANAPVVDVVELEHQVDLALAAELAGIDMETLYRLNPGYNRWATAPGGPHRLLLPIDRIAAFNEGLAQTPPQSWMRWERHRIASGETLGEIAARYHITVADLQAANDINGHIIRAGDHLLVPVASRPAGNYTLSAGQRLAATRSTPQDGRSRLDYTVRAGDSFWAIAQRHDVGVRELARWNGMAPGDTLAVGRQLTIWTENAGSGNASGLAAIRSDNRLQSVTYTVRQGDSLYRIANRFKVQVADLQRWNGISEGAYLQPGQRLRLQVDVTAQSNL